MQVTHFKKRFKPRLLPTFFLLFLRIIGSEDTCLPILSKTCFYNYPGRPVALHSALTSCFLWEIIQEGAIAIVNQIELPLA